jgi:hypothetical protein
VSVLKLIDPFIDLRKFSKSLLACPTYLKDLLQYTKMGGGVKLKDLHPVLDETSSVTKVDSHYFYQDLWAFRKILENKPDKHVDVGSNNKLISFLTAIITVEFIDIRPLEVGVENLINERGSILDLPYETSSVQSLSCLHVAEHIGLGRYGDPIDPKGTEKGCQELSRVLGVGGNLYFGIPLGKPRVCFNAHRIHNSAQILKYFSSLKLIDFSGIDDNGKYYPRAEVTDFDQNDYSCGLFQFTKE